MKRRKSSIRKKIFLAMMIISMVPISLFAYFSLNTTYSAMYKQLIDSRKTSMEWLNEHLISQVRFYTNQFYEYEVDKEMKASIVSWPLGQELLHTDQQRIRQSFETTLNMKPKIKSIEIYNLSTGQGYVSSRSSFHAVPKLSSENIWNERAEHLQTNIVFETDNEDLLIMHRTNNFATGKGAAVIVVRMSSYTFTDILDKVKGDSGETGETVFLFNDEDKILLPQLEEAKQGLAVQQLLQTLKETPGGVYSADNSFYFYKSVSGGKLQVVYIVPNKILVNTIHKTTTIAVVIILLAIVAAVMLSFIFSRIISRPIISLSKLMQVANIQDFAKKEPVARYDEIGLLQRSFGIMMHRNQALIASEYKTKLEKRNAELHALQAQINPHFMYNTLQVIGGMAVGGQSNNIYPVVTALSDIMRYSFRFSQEMVPLKQELDYLEAYLSIQKHRFDDRIMLEIAVPDTLQAAYIPKLMLQPILENSFEHGLQHKAGQWLIQIQAYVEEDSDCLCIRVVDNGLGITKERLNWIRQQLNEEEIKVLSSPSHIGLANVHARILLRYGHGFGVSVDSVEGEGTTVYVRTKLDWGDS